MKTLLLSLSLVLALILALSAFAKDEVTQRYTNCRYVEGSDNTPHLFDESEIYQCSEGKVEIIGKAEKVIENGYVYEFDLGRINTQTHRATAQDYADHKWCSDPSRVDPHQKRMCGDVPVKCWDGKIATWDEQWQGYSCVTPDHGGKGKQ